MTLSHTPKLDLEVTSDPSFHKLKNAITEKLKKQWVSDDVIEALQLDQLLTKLDLDGYKEDPENLYRNIFRDLKEHVDGTLTIGDVTSSSVYQSTSFHVSILGQDHRSSDTGIPQFLYTICAMIFNHVKVLNKPETVEIASTKERIMRAAQDLSSLA